MIHEVTPITDQLMLVDGAKVFLAGSIDMGNSTDWQQEAVELLKQKADKNISVFNPRRAQMDSLDAENVAYQINWELDKLLNESFELDVILFNFAPNSLSPITLLELGLCLAKFPYKCIIVCPESYSRYQNVALTCQRFNVNILPTLEVGINALLYHLHVYSGININEKFKNS